MKKIFILFILAAAAMTTPVYGQDGFRFDTIRRASPPSRATVSSTGTRAQASTPTLSARELRKATKPIKTKRRNPGYWTFGGNLGFGFGDYTSINVAPKVSYRFNRTLSVGGGFNYNYYDHRHYDYTLNYFGMNAFTQIYPVQYITLFVQPEFQRRWGQVWGYDDRSELFGCLLVGGGLVIPTGRRGAMTVTFYYDLVQNRYSPYGDNIGYSVGYSFRL